MCVILGNSFYVYGGIDGLSLLVDIYVLDIGSFLIILGFFICDLYEEFCLIE